MDEIPPDSPLRSARAGEAWRLYFRSDGARQTRLHDAKYEYRIPMRDGVTLFTQVYLAKDRSRTYPTPVQRTSFGVSPYGPNRYRTKLGPSPALDRLRYIFVVKDVRGRFQSQGTFVAMRRHIDQPAAGQTDESTDMYDTVQWLLKHAAANNGRVGIWGVSSPGFYTSASIIDSHPAIKAASILVPMTNLFLGDGSDCIVKLIDEDATGTHAPGYQQLVRGEPMPDINNTFLRGHRLVVQVQSSSFPLAAVNPQAFAPNVGATPDAVVKATELVFHEPSAASSLALQVLRR